MQRPKVVAHRGSSMTNAEHTLGAYLAALDEGADGLECDVRLTADGHLVCVHDRDLRRTATTEGVVSTMSLAQLEDLDFASWKNPWADLDDEAKDMPAGHGTVLTMRTLLETVANYPRRVELAIETKHPTRYSGLVERRLVELLDDFGWAGQDSPARVMSFSLTACRRVRKLAPDLDVVFLMDRHNQWPRSRPFADPNWFAGPGIKLLRRNPEWGRRIAARTDLHVWTVNTDEDIDLCLDLGVKAIITDRPGVTQAYLDKLKI
ncbi:MAG: glycerophosphodiester phosphodiesterase [Myxococcales bacterium]|nr:MAG: glycerophosphodiester phosphodiesterase [Myxococcales bacterium]